MLKWETKDRGCGHSHVDNKHLRNLFETAKPILAACRTAHTHTHIIQTSAHTSKVTLISQCWNDGISALPTCISIGCPFHDPTEKPSYFRRMTTVLMTFIDRFKSIKFQVTSKMFKFLDQNGLWMDFPPDIFLPPFEISEKLWVEKLISFSIFHSFSLGDTLYVLYLYAIQDTSIIAYCLACFKRVDG